MCSMSQLKNPTLEWLSAAVSVTEEDVWCNIFTSRKQQISIPLSAPDRVSHLISAAGVSVPRCPRCPHLHIVLTLAHVNTLFTVCQSTVPNHVSSGCLSLSVHSAAYIYFIYLFYVSYEIFIFACTCLTIVFYKYFYTYIHKQQIQFFDIFTDMVIILYIYIFLCMTVDCSLLFHLLSQNAAVR